MKRKLDEMNDEGDFLDYELAEDVPLNENEVIIETSPSPEESNDRNHVVYRNETGLQVYNNLAEALEARRQRTRSESPECVTPRNGYNQLATKLVKLKGELIAPNVDVVEAGKMVIYGNVDNSIESNKVVDKVIKSACNVTHNTGDIEIFSLVSTLMHDSPIDARFAMVGTSIMWNVLKTNVRTVNQNLNIKLTAASPSDHQFSRIDIDGGNLRNRSYKIEENEPFVEADLKYIFSLLTFRDSAKLLNKTKQMIKAYLIVACRPRCLIWRYTVRKSKSSHKKTIMDLPAHVLDAIIEFLLDSTGVGKIDVPFEHLDKSTPFYAFLGYMMEEKKLEYTRICHSRDSLTQFFKNAVTDCLNEIREMPFSLETGTLTSPLRGRTPNHSCITWKHFEALLKDCGDSVEELNATCKDILDAVIPFCPEHLPPEE